MSNVVRHAQEQLSNDVAGLRKQVGELLSLINRPTDRSITGFCKRQGISRGTYYNLPPKKRPRVAHVNGRRIITPTAERDWEIEREAEGASAKTPPG